MRNLKYGASSPLKCLTVIHWWKKNSTGSLCPVGTSNRAVLGMRSPHETALFKVLTLYIVLAEVAAMQCNWLSCQRANNHAEKELITWWWQIKRMPFCLHKTNQLTETYILPRSTIIPVALKDVSGKNSCIGRGRTLPGGWMCRGQCYCNTLP